MKFVATDLGASNTRYTTEKGAVTIMPNNMVSVADYAGMPGFGMASAAEAAELVKALNTNNYAQANGVAGQTGGSALIPESLESQLKVLTYSDQHVKFWKAIAKSPAYSTVEEYTQLLSYGSQTGAFVPHSAGGR